MSKKGERIFLALSGGNTPKLFFQQLATWAYQDNINAINWSLIHVFWVDERCVPPDHPESNFGMAQAVLLSKLKLNAGQIHRIKGEDNPVHEVHRYTDEIMRTVPLLNGLPRFDHIFLGIGEDGHTASIFPDHTDLIHTDRICELVSHPVTGQKRITMTLKPINNARRITFLVTGETKSEIIRKVSLHSSVAGQYPANYVEPVHGKLEWYLDEKAAKHIL